MVYSQRLSACVLVSDDAGAPDLAAIEDLFLECAFFWLNQVKQLSVGVGLTCAASASSAVVLRQTHKRLSQWAKTAPREDEWASADSSELCAAPSGCQHHLRIVLEYPIFRKYQQSYRGFHAKAATLPLPLGPYYEPRASQRAAAVELGVFWFVADTARQCARCSRRARRSSRWRPKPNATGR